MCAVVLPQLSVHHFLIFYSTKIVPQIPRISREDHSNVHIFSSAFYEYLENYGPECAPHFGFTSSMNVFEKKFLFIPVWLDNHVALCVVVNPGHISNNTDEDAPQDEEHAW